MMEDIATVSLDRPAAELAGELGASFREWGFAVVRDHGIPGELTAHAWELTRRFFALPEAAKRTYHIPGIAGARGYTPFGSERAKDARVHDLKEFWHIGRSLEPGDPLEAYMEPNVWPVELPEFRETFEALYAAFAGAGGRILSAIALYLGLTEDYFSGPVENGNSVLRLLHYPPLPEGAADGAIRAAPHGDINAITLLLGAEESGLQLLTAKGSWLPIHPPEGALVVNIGDMLERLTNNRLKSTLHRVVNPVGEAAARSRYAMPFFLHFRPDFLIDTLPGCVDAQHPDLYPEPITAHAFLLQRLREINLA